MKSFRGTLDRYLPGWLKPRPGGKDRGYRFLYAMAFLCDVGMQYALEGRRARFPGVGTPTALPYVGRDRQIVRGLSEPDDVYAGRLLRYLDDHRTQGNPFTLMRQVRGFLFPSTALERVVNNQATWYTLNPDGTTEWTNQAGNWDWDGQDLKARFWLIIYPGPFDPEDTWGTGVWGDGGTWGSTATPNQVRTLRAIIDEWRSATGLAVNVILAMDDSGPFFPESIAPPLPDGTWGNYSRNDGGTQIRARDYRGRYLQGT